MKVLRGLTAKASENNSVPRHAYVSEVNYSAMRREPRQEQTVAALVVNGDIICYCFLYHDDLPDNQIHLSKGLIGGAVVDGAPLDVEVQDVSAIPYADAVRFSILSDFEVFDRNKEIALNLLHTHDLPVFRDGRVSIMVRDQVEGNIEIDFSLSPEPSQDVFRIGPDVKMIGTSTKPQGSATKEAELGDYSNHIAGMDEQVARVVSVIDVQLKSLKQFRKFGLKPSKGLLLIGPPGTGKTLLARTVAKVSDAEFFHKNASEFFGQFAGTGEQQLRAMFEAASKCPRAIIFIDEIDVITADRDHAQEDFTRRLVNQFLPLMDGLDEGSNTIIMGATNRPHIIDPAFRRPGRFDREILMQMPTPSDRSEIFDLYLNRMGGFSEIDRDKLAEMSDGYVGADIEGVCKEVVLKHIEHDEPISLSLFESVLSHFVCSRDRAFPRARKLKDIEFFIHGHEEVDRNREDWEKKCDHVLEMNALINDSFSAVEGYLSQASTYYAGYELWISNAHYMDEKDFVKTLNLISVSGFGISRVRVLTDDQRTQKLVQDSIA